MTGLLLTLFVAATPGAGAKTRVCLIDVSDTSNQLVVAKVTPLLETELRKVFTVVPNRRVMRAAQAANLPRNGWFEAPALARLGAALGFEVGLGARGAATLGTWTVYLTAYDVSTGSVLGESHVTLTRPRLAEDRAHELVTSLVQALKKPEPVTTPAPEPVVAPTPAPASGGGDDVWDQATEGFSSTSASSPSSVVDTLRAETRVEVGGRVGFEHYAFFKNVDGDKLAGRDSVDGAVRLKAIHPRATAFVSILARHDFADPTRDRFDPDEAWLEVNFPGVTVKAGRFAAAWGTASLYNPSDVLSPIDFRDPLDSEKLGTLMLKASATLGPATLEAYYLPVPDVHRLPTIMGISASGQLLSRSRWVRGSVDLPGSAPVTFSVSPMVAPEPRPANSQVAARLLLSVAGFDVSLGYGWLIDRFPSQVLEAVPDPGVPLNTTVYVDWLYRRMHVITLDVERTFGKLRLAAEGAAFLTRDLTATNRNVADPYVIVDVAADLQTGAFLGDQHLHFFLEFVTAQALAGKLPETGLDLWRTPFRLALLGRIAWEIRSDLHVNLNATTSLRRFDVFLSPRLEYSFFDRVKAEVGVDLLFGDPDHGFFGPYRDNSRFVVSLESRF